MPFSHRLRVRYAECDPQGIVFNANHFLYFDVAVTELWRDAFGSYEAMIERGVDMVVASTGADFHGAPRFDDELDVGVAIERMGTTSLTVRLEQRRDGELLVSGRTVYVFVDAATMAKTEIPAWIRERLSAYASA